MLRRVAIENFGPHKRWYAEPGEGVNLILGDNGDGKSNIVYAIGWCLKGTKALPYAQSTIINDDATSCSVTVDLDLMGALHSFFRSYNGKSVDARVVRDGEVVAETASGVEEYLEKLGLDWDAFSVLFSRQKDLDKFIDSIPGEKKKIFDSLLSMEAVMEAAKKCKDTAAKILSEKPPILSKDEEDIDKNLAKAMEDLVEAQEDFELSEKVFGGRQEDYEIAKAAITGTDTKQVDALNTLFNEANRVIYVLEQEIKPLQQLADKWKEDPEDYKTTIKQVEADKQRLRKEEITTLNSAATLLGEANRLQGEIEALQTLGNSLQTGVDCPLCGAKEYDAELSKEKLDKETIQGLTKDQKKAEAEWKRMSDECNSKTSQLRERTRTKEKLESYLVNAVGASAAREELPGLSVKLANAKEDAAKIEEVRRTFGTANPDDVNAFQIAEIVYNDAQSDLYSAKYAVTRAESAVKAAQEVSDSYKKARQLYSDRIASAGVFSVADKSLRKFRDQALQDALEWVSSRATQIWRSAGAIEGLDEDAKIELDDKLDFWIVSSEKRIPVYRLSGGQKATFSISLRIALSDFLSERLGLHGLLILDAAFDSIDERNRNVVGQALDFADVDQALVFSHFDIETIPAQRFIL